MEAVEKALATIRHAPHCAAPAIPAPASNDGMPKSTDETLSAPTKPAQHGLS
jgi:hypothetical protein